MKSVLGLLGLSLLVFSCGGNGNALFEPVAGAGPSGGSMSNSGSNGAGNSASGSAGQSTGGSSSGNGGQATSGSGGASGTLGGGGAGPVTLEVIYVATAGNDDAQCGLTTVTACKSISQGVTRAVEVGRSEVDVQAGSYPGIVVLKPGVHVVGGFDSAWQAGPRSEDAHKVVIEGGLHEATQEYLAVWAHDLVSQASLANLLINAPAAQGQRASSIDGRSSYGIHAFASTLSLTDIDITAGNGGNGGNGANGDDAVATNTTDIMSGKVGGNGVVTNVSCNTEAAPGGEPGSNQCASSPSVLGMSGGRGGDGGARDFKCSGGGNTNYAAQPGSSGSDAVTVVSLSGKGGAGGSGGSACGVTGPGQPGAVSNGAGGKASSGGYVVADFWYAAAGGDGGTGQNGGGGGGGGGAGGCDSKLSANNGDARGAAGGGGGAGGCAARGGGHGGGGGGGSFGIFAVGSSISVSGVNITRGSGGTGGAGGSGGQGQSGGLGQAGGANPGAQNPGTASPGSGGNGAHGGHGGGGAGGTGGRSYGIVLSANSGLAGTPTVAGGQAGLGGAGGASAPNAPQAERDGNSGEVGADGAVGETLDCGANASC